MTMYPCTPPSWKGVLTIRLLFHKESGRAMPHISQWAGRPRGHLQVQVHPVSYSGENLGFGFLIKAERLVGTQRYSTLGP